ncbi:MAG: cobalamin-independent methionine synthase II family protein [Candidatus Dormibacteraeota bacterium]|nr:cobalamin-independent methionine synthase II family protein [Candidatus Dormibacteraeota bacterium]
MVSAAEDGNVDDGLEPRLRAAVADAVSKQLEVGIDIVNDGEQSKSGFAYYVKRRLAGPTELAEGDGPPPVPMSVRDRRAFPGYFNRGSGNYAAWWRHYVVDRPISYQGHAAVQADVARLRSALDEAKGGADAEGVLMSIAPGTIEHWMHNRHYPDEEAYLLAIAEAMHEEYRTITDAGLMVQVDDPGLADSWQMYPEMSVPEYRRYAELRVEALNHALRGIPPERVILHVCWGSFHTPHVNDLPLRDIVEVLFKANVQGISIEQSNPRHEHEWKVFEEVRLPEDKVLIPGVVGHATDIVEHPELVAQRISNYARLVGRERVVGGTDCGIGSRVAHAEVAWAKLSALAEGARLASRELWGVSAAL